MIISEEINALKMIKPEINAALKCAQEALKNFSDYPGDQEALHFCLKSCGQLRGIFCWLNFSAGLALMREVAELGKNLLGFSLQYEAHPHSFNEKKFNELIIIFSETLLVLNRYLEYSLDAHKFLPVLLIPTMNKLRRANERPILEESAFFYSKECLPPPFLPSSHCASVEFSEQLVRSVKSLRQLYQVSLLAVMKGENIPEQLTRFHHVISKMYGWSAKTMLAPLWWVALAAIEAMQTQQIKLTPARLSLFQKLDKPLKALAYEGENILNTPPAPALMSACIYMASLAENSEAKILTQVRKAYGLHTYLLDSVLRVERDVMEGPENSTVSSVIQELQREVNQIKITLEKYVAELEPDIYSLVSALNKTAKTCSMIGLAESAQLLQNQASLLTTIQVNSELSNLMAGLADTLLSVEQTMVSLPSVLQAEGVAITESLNNVSLIGRYIESWMSTGERPLLTKLLPIFENTCGVLYFLQLVRAESILYKAGLFFEEKCLEDPMDFPCEKEFSLLADAVVGVEYYLEMMSKNQWVSDSVLERAESSALLLRKEVSVAV